MVPRLTVRSPSAGRGHLTSRHLSDEQDQEKRLLRMTGHRQTVSEKTPRLDLIMEDDFCPDSGFP